MKGTCLCCVQVESAPAEFIDMLGGSESSDSDSEDDAIASRLAGEVSDNL